MLTVKGKTVILSERDLSPNGYNTPVLGVELTDFKKTIQNKLDCYSVIIYKTDYGACKVLKSGKGLLYNG